MPPEPTTYSQPAGRFMEILVGLLAIGASGLLGYFGARGGWMYLHGSRTAPANPYACAIGLGAGLWGGYAGLRMVFGWKQDRALVPASLLLIVGIVALLGGVLLIVLNLFLQLSLPRGVGIGIVLATVGLAAIKLGRARMQSATHSSANAT